MLKKILRVFSKVFPFLVVITFLFLFLETFFYYGFVEKYLLINSRFFMSLTVIFALIAIKSRKSLVFILNKYIFIASLAVFLAMMIIELFNYPNYIFSHFHLQPDNFFYVVTFSACLLLPPLSYIWYSYKNVLNDFLLLLGKLSNPKNKKTVFLFILPILLLLVSFSTKRWAGPYWLASNSDPEYVYLLNSLNMTQFKDVGHTDHPGTPLQMMGAGVLVGVHFFLRGNDLVTDVLSRPELYLNIENYFLIFLSITSLFLIGVFTLSLTNRLLYGLIMQLTPFLSTALLYVFYRVTPEHLLFIAGLWYSFSILYLYYKNKYRIRHLIFLSLISGFLIATKINASPLIVLPLIFLPFRAKIKYVLGTFASLVLFTLPIYRSYINFVKWVYKLFIHVGLYGTGASSIIETGQFIRNLLIILSSERFPLLLLLVILLVLILHTKNKKTHKQGSFLLGIFFMFMIQVIIVAKHFDLHYLIPVLSTVGMTVVLLLSFISYGRKRWFDIVKFLIVILIFILAINNFNSVLQNTRTISEEYRDSLNMDSLINNYYQSYIRVSYYDSSSQQYALSFGNIFALNDYNHELSRLYPNQIFYDIWDRTFYDWNRSIDLPDTTKVIFEGTTEFMDPKFKSNKNFKEVYHGTTESLYTLN